MGHSDHFEFSSTVNEFLFKNFHIRSVIGLLGACLVLALIAIVYEGIRLLRDCLTVWSHKKTPQIGESSPLQQQQAAPVDLSRSPPFALNWSSDHMGQSALHMAQMFVGYLLMLSVMTYNGWLMAAILTGAGLGAFVMRPWPASKWYELAHTRHSHRGHIQRQQENSEDVPSVS